MSACVTLGVTEELPNVAVELLNVKVELVVATVELPVLWWQALRTCLCVVAGEAQTRLTVATARGQNMQNFMLRRMRNARKNHHGTDVRDWAGQSTHAHLLSNREGFW